MWFTDVVVLVFLLALISYLLSSSLLLSLTSVFLSYFLLITLLLLCCELLPCPLPSSPRASGGKIGARSTPPLRARGGRSSERPACQDLGRCVWGLGSGVGRILAAWLLLYFVLCQGYVSGIGEIAPWVVTPCMVLRRSKAGGHIFI